MPSISIIVPVYQAEKYLSKCIESVLRQTFSDWELLLIDDGCRDSSPAICDRYAEKDDRIRKIIVLSLILLAILVIAIRYIVKMLKNRPDEKAMSVIRHRLSVLDKVIASRISSDEKLYQSSEEEINVLMEDREEFLCSTKIVFEESHPKFIAYLQEKGLTDWEIGYCCLYTLGLKGKDIGEYIQKKRHYIISHEIRQKLSLGKHETNISIYLRNLLLDLER